MSVLQSALQKIGGQENFNADPLKEESDLWVRIQSDSRLNVFELSALKNERCVGKSRHLFSFFIIPNFMFYLWEKVVDSAGEIFIDSILFYYLYYFVLESRERTIRFLEKRGDIHEFPFLFVSTNFIACGVISDFRKTTSGRFSHCLFSLFY